MKYSCVLPQESSRRVRKIRFAKSARTDQELLVRIALEQRLLLCPAMSLMTRGALDRVHLLDGRQLEGLRVHRVAGVNHLARVRALNQDAVHSGLSLVLRPSAKKVPPVDSGGAQCITPGSPDALHLCLYCHCLRAQPHLVGDDKVIGAGGGKVVVESVLRAAKSLPR